MRDSTRMANMTVSKSGKGFGVDDYRLLFLAEEDWPKIDELKKMKKQYQGQYSIRPILNLWPNRPRKILLGLRCRRAQNRPEAATRPAGRFHRSTEKAGRRLGQA